MIVLLLADTMGSVNRPTIDKDCNGVLELCEDGLDREDRKHLVYGCPGCGTWLFDSSELRWAYQDGYWKSPAHTLQKPCYDIPTEIIKCPSCDWTTKLFFFSYGG